MKPADGALVPQHASFDLGAWEGKLAVMRRQIEEARTVQECLFFSDVAEAVLAAFKIGGALIQDQNRVARMKVDAERKAGELLEAMPKAGAGRPAKNRCHVDTNLNGNGKATYADMAEQIGVTKAAFQNLANRSQLIATVPAADYEMHLEALVRKGLVITSQYFISLGRKYRHKAHRRKLAGAVSIRHRHVLPGDFRTVLADLPDQSVSLIFTDPPYDRASVPLYRDLAQLAARVLIDGGSLVCYAGQYALPEVFPRMTPWLKYQWAFAVRHSGGHRRQHGWKVRVAWKPLLWFVKGRYEGEYLMDLLDSSPGDKSLHDWAQGCAEAAYLIDKLCPETGLVLDPLCGSGTTLVAAKRLGRRYLGAEIDPQRARVAEMRLRNSAGNTETTEP
jgi:site-specific DNA-methyltransferase (adenine-specific)